MLLTLISALIILSLFILLALLRLLFRQEQVSAKLSERDNHQWQLQENLTRLLKDQQQEQQEQRNRFDEHQFNSLKLLQESLQHGMAEIRAQITETLKTNADFLGKSLDKLTQNTNEHLKEISGQVEKRLSDGFEKTTAVFQDVIKRLALIDEAQKKITELSGNVVSLQEVLADKRSRGAFGEVQLVNLIRNVMPEQSFALQHTLSNAKR